MLNKKLTGVAIVSILCVAACSSKAPMVDTAASQEEMTHDGLYPLRNVAVDRAWVRRDIDLSGYTKVIVKPAGIQYRPVKARPGSHRIRSSSHEFPISEKNKERLREELTAAFNDELAEGVNFEVVSEPGPDVLIVVGGLIDVVSFVPPERVGRHEVYLDRVGEASFVVELRDSQSEAVLARVIDRRAAEQINMSIESNSVSNWSEVKRLGRYWARRLRLNLDNLATNLEIGASQ